MFHIALVEPEIPSNTGNISRTCSVTGCALHLVKPLGFCVDDKHLKRAGLDYWSTLDLAYHESFWEMKKEYKQASFYLFSTHATKLYTEAAYRPGDFLVFGKETAGLGKEILAAHPDSLVRIPMLPELRSLNLSNSVAIALYEALRQNNFSGME